VLIWKYLRESDTIGLIPHWGKQCSDAVWASHGDAVAGSARYGHPVLWRASDDRLHTQPRLFTTRFKKPWHPCPVEKKAIY